MNPLGIPFESYDDFGRFRLEESLEQFPGAVVLVTHDRYLLDRVCDELLALQPGEPPVAFGALAAWESYRDRKQRDATAAARSESAAKSPAATATLARSGDAAEKPRGEAPRRLSYKEKIEFEGMEANILAAEERAAPPGNRR